MAPVVDDTHPADGGDHAKEDGEAEVEGESATAGDEGSALVDESQLTDDEEGDELEGSISETKTNSKHGVSSPSHMIIGDKGSKPISRFNEVPFSDADMLMAQALARLLHMEVLEGQRVKEQEEKERQSNISKAELEGNDKMKVEAKKKSDDDDDEDEGDDATPLHPAHYSEDHIGVPKIATGGLEQFAEDERKAIKLLSSRDEREGAPDKVFLISGYPKNVAETEALLRYYPRGLDAIFEIVCSDTVDQQGGGASSNGGNEERGDTHVTSSKTKEAFALPPANDDIAAMQTFAKQRLEWASLKGGLLESLKATSISSRTSYWRDMAFLKVKVDDDQGNPLDVSNIAIQFAQLASDMGVERHRYQRLLDACQVIDAPNAVTDFDGILQSEWERLGPNGKQATLELYESIIGDFPEQALGIPLIVAAMTETIARSLNGNPPKAGKHDFHASQIVIDYGDYSGRRISQGASEIGGFASDVQLLNIPALSLERAVVTKTPVPGGSGRVWMPSEPVLSDSVRGTTKTEFSSFLSTPWNEYLRAEILQRFENMLNEVDRDTLEPYSFDNREFHEYLPAHVLPQVISKAMTEEDPEMYAHYLEGEDLLLLALHRRTPKGRRCTMLESPFGTGSRIRPSFSLWTSMNEELRKTWMRRCNGGLIDLDEGLLLPLISLTEVLYPADHSVVYVQQGGASGNQIKVLKDNYQFALIPTSRSIHPLVSAGCVVDKKKEEKSAPKDSQKKKADKSGHSKHPPFAGHFVSVFEDGSRVVVHEGSASTTKPDGFNTIQVSCTCNSGLIATACTDGTITQQFLSGRGSIDAGEMLRTYNGDGTVTRKMYDGSIQIYFSNGATAYKAAPPLLEGDDINTTSSSADITSSWIITSVDGHRYAQLSSGKIEVMEPITVTKQLDPETEAVVTTRSEPLMGRIVVADYKDSTRVVAIEDGTTITTPPAGAANEDGEVGPSTVTISTPGFAAVEFDIGFGKMAKAHASGKRIALAKGGMYSRATLFLPDGTQVDIKYDTRVTARVNGCIVVTKRDASTVTAYDNTVVEMRPGNMNNNSLTLEGMFPSKEKDQREGAKPVAEARPDTPRSTRESPDTTSGVYIFNCLGGTMDVDDHEHNHFYATLAGEIHLDLAGELPGLPAHAVVNFPMQPRLFILNGTGTGIELLRNEDVVEFNRINQLDAKYVKALPPTPVMLEDGTASKKSLSYSFIRDIARGEFDGPLIRELPNIVKLNPEFKSGKSMKGNTNLLPKSVGVIVRTIEKLGPVSSDMKVKLDVERVQYQKWLDARAAAYDRYYVGDNRSSKEISADANMQQRIIDARKKRELALRPKKKKKKQGGSVRNLQKGTSSRSVKSDKSSKANLGGTEAGDLQFVPEEDEVFGEDGNPLSGDYNPNDEERPRGRLSHPRPKRYLSPERHDNDKRELASYWASEEGSQVVNDGTLGRIGSVKEAKLAKYLAANGHSGTSAIDAHQINGNDESAPSLSGTSPPSNQESSDVDCNAQTAPAIMNAAAGSAVKAVRKAKQLSTESFEEEENLLYERRESETLRQIHISSTSREKARSPSRNQPRPLSNTSTTRAGAGAASVAVAFQASTDPILAPPPVEFPKIEVSPSTLDLGELNKEGRYTRQITLKNDGNVAARYRVSHPRGSMSLKDGYTVRVTNKTPFIAPGILTTLDIEVHTHSRSAKDIKEVIEITTEHKIFRIPLTAKIIIPQEYPTLKL